MGHNTEDIIKSLVNGLVLALWAFWLRGVHQEHVIKEPVQKTLKSLSLEYNSEGIRCFFSGNQDYWCLVHIKPVLRYI